MTRKLFAVLVCASMLFASLACQLTASPNAPKAPGNNGNTSVDGVQTSAPEATATEDTAASDTATAEAVTSATAKAAEQNAKATEDAQLAATQTAQAKATDRAVQKMARTATAVSQATAQADGMYQLVQSLKDEGVITSTDGAYSRLDDFEESWAQLNWYQWWNTGYTPSDFVIRAHTAWESASRTANWFSAGCGFVFRAQDEDNHYMIFLALDGNVYMRGYVDGIYREFGKKYAGKIAPVKGEADVILAVQGDHFVYYVNGEKVFDRHNSELAEGDLGLTLNSGTNKDFGTRCEIKDIELWELEGQ